MEPLHPLYHHYLDVLDVAFQPIVDIHTGTLFGVEALLRGTDVLGFETIGSFFDHLYTENILYSFDLSLREKVIEKFCSIDGYEQLKLFYNLDNRVLEMSDFSKGNTCRILEGYGLDQRSIVFELSERNEILNFDHFTRLMSHYAEEGFCIAIDDFGTGQSGYKLLYHCTPNILKIDRFFLSGIDRDPKKKLLVRHIVHLSTLMGCRVIAEGIETEKELLVAKEIGCHMVQGYLVQRPVLATSMIRESYPHITDDPMHDKRSRSDQFTLLKRLETIEAIDVNESMVTLMERFRQNEELSFIPVVDVREAPIGVIREHSLKSVIYSPYGRSLIENRSSHLSVLESYIEPLPVVDVAMPMETIIGLFSLAPNAPGVLVVESSRYIGYLSAREMVEVIHERSLMRARDENPLTKLPGNHMINEYLTRLIEHRDDAVACYFDFDHFKPFNDHYGFRNGDRVIVLFAELMYKKLCIEYFKGHIGGDDFIAGIQLNDTHTFETVCADIESLIAQFREDVREFYGPNEREQGGIVIEDRDGVRRRFDLMGASAVVVRIGPTSSFDSVEKLQKAFAQEKKAAKQASSHIRILAAKGM